MFDDGNSSCKKLGMRFGKSCKWILFNHNLLFLLEKYKYHTANCCFIIWSRTLERRLGYKFFHTEYSLSVIFTIQSDCYNRKNLTHFTWCLQRTMIVDYSKLVYAMLACLAKYFFLLTNRSVAQFIQF